MERLPSELLCYICEYLTIPDIQHFRCVNKYNLQSISNYKPRLLYLLELYREPDDLVEKYAKLISSISNQREDFIVRFIITRLHYYFFPTPIYDVECRSVTEMYNIFVEYGLFSSFYDNDSNQFIICEMVNRIKHIINRMLCNRYLSITVDISKLFQIRFC